MVFAGVYAPLRNTVFFLQGMNEGLRSLIIFSFEYAFSRSFPSLLPLMRLLGHSRL